MLWRKRHGYSQHRRSAFISELLRICSLSLGVHVHPGCPKLALTFAFILRHGHTTNAQSPSSV